MLLSILSIPYDSGIDTYRYRKFRYFCQACYYILHTLASVHSGALQMNILHVLEHQLDTCTLSCVYI
jgi:hypothetical protein